MRKLLIGLALLAACSRSTRVEPAGGPGARAPRPAVDAFLAAIRAQDLQALAAVWGTADGPIRDNKRLSRSELEQRELVLIRCFKHDHYRVTSDEPAANAERVLRVTLDRGTLSRSTNFYVVRGGDRWYVRSADMEGVRDLCAAK